MELEQKQISCDLVPDRIPPVFAKYPWLVTHNLEVENNTREHDLLSRYRCQIPELLGKRIWRCFHGWMILSDHPHNKMWSLWNPVTSNVIHLPPLFLKHRKFKHIAECCLSAPPDDSSSVLMLTTTEHTIVYCRVTRKRKRSKWMEISYTKQLRSIMGYDDGYLRSLTCCNGKVYALNTIRYCKNKYINIDIVVKDIEVVISLLPCGELPYPYISYCSKRLSFLKGYMKELFYVTLGLHDVESNEIGALRLFKLDMTSMLWEELEDLKDATFFLDVAHDYAVSYIPVIASELGGSVQILGKSGNGKVIYSCDVKNKTVSLIHIPSLVLPTSHVSLWECRLQGDHGEIKSRAPYQEKDTENDQITLVRSVRDYGVGTRIEPHEENVESRLVNIPFDILKMIMEHCVGLEYLNLRATCKHCLLAAPMIRWSNGIALRKLQTYSLVSPWLMVFEKHQGIISFTDPMLGGKYFLKTPGELIGDIQIHSSKYGWLLVRKNWGDMMFYNPFTNDIRKLPSVPYLNSFCFSAPPTSPDCMVVGFTTLLEWHVYVHFVGREAYWHRYRLNFDYDDSHSFRFPTFHDRKLYALCNDGGLNRFTDIDKDVFTWRKVIAKGPRDCGSSSQSFLTQCDQHLLLVLIGEFGESVDVFRLNDSTCWKKVESLGKDMIYISGTTCLCVEAKTPEMRNKIYFPRLHDENEKIVFYSLETRRYHTFNGRNVEENFEGFFGTKHHLNLHAWIEPSWS